MHDPPRDGTAPELLAPAGDWDAMRAAVANGADAVYFGLEDFNARRRAENFTLDGLPEVVRYLHDHNTRGYVTLNTLVFSDELPRAARFAAEIARAGADAVIVQDVGLMRLIRRRAPTLPIHASTQTTQTEPYGIEALQSLGVSRVILARELTLAELAELMPRARLPVEVFVHGALCVSYSGQCLASESLFGRSANRGVCAQACRLPYRLVVDGRPQDAGERGYVLSAQDLAAYDRIRPLVELGVAALKIEGRLKSAAYVAAATRIYRAAVDAAVRREPFDLSDEQREELAQSFSRGMGHGFLDAVDHRALVHGRFPKNRGVCVGRVVGRTKSGVLIQRDAAAAVAPGDGVVFDEGHPERDEQGGRVYEVRQAGRMRLELAFGRGDVNPAAVPLGSLVWKTDDPAIRRRLERSVRREGVVRRVPLWFRVEARVGAPLRIVGRDGDGREAIERSEQPLAPAEKHSLTLALLRAQLGRLGDTPFELAGVELIGPAGPAESSPVMAPKSVLNDLRRRIVADLLRQRAEAARHPVAEPDALERFRDEVRRPLEPAAPPVMHVLCRTWEQFETVLSAPPAGGPESGVVYVDFPEMRDTARAVVSARTAGRRIGLATPRILHPRELAILDRLAGLEPDLLLVRSLGAVRRLRERFGAIPLVGDFSLNAANEIAAAELAALGLERLAPGCDLSLGQLLAAARRFAAGRFEAVIHHHVPMFHTRHCLFAAHLGGAGACDDCDHPCRRHDLRLRDRIGVEHPVAVDALGRNTIFHAGVQSAAELLEPLRDAGLRHFRIEMVDESAPLARRLLDLYARLLFDRHDVAETVERLRSLFPGRFTRGTWEVRRVARE